MKAWLAKIARQWRCEHKWTRALDCPAVFVMNWRCLHCGKRRQTFFKDLSADFCLHSVFMPGCKQCESAVRRS
jgi:hypothetical protein